MPMSTAAADHFRGTPVDFHGAVHITACYKCLHGTALRTAVTCCTLS